MPARDIKRDDSMHDTAADIAPPAAETEQSKFKSEGELPAVAKAQAVPVATASELAFDKKPQSGDTSGLDQGMYEPDDYRTACAQAGKSEKWDDKYSQGHTSAKQFTQPYDGRALMSFNLKKGMSASQAVKDFLKGPTIADYQVISVAGQLDELRDDLGDHKFDQLFGSAHELTDGAIPGGQRLKISASMYTIPFVDQMKQIAADHDAKAVAVAEPKQAAPVAERRENKPQQLDNEKAPIVGAKQPEVEQVGRELL